MSMGIIENGAYKQVAGNAALQAPYIETIWTGNATKGDNIGTTLNLADYDIVIGVVGGRYAYLQNIPENGQKNKFVAHWTGRDIVNQALYWQEYVCDILSDGTIITCGWISLVGDGHVVTDVTETNLTITKIFGIKFPEID